MLPAREVSWRVDTFSVRVAVMYFCCTFIYIKTGSRFIGQAKVGGVGRVIGDPLSGVDETSIAPRQKMFNKLFVHAHCTYALDIRPPRMCIDLPCVSC